MSNGLPEIENKKVENFGENDLSNILKDWLQC